MVGTGRCIRTSRRHQCTNHALHAIDATPRTRQHHTHWLICTQVGTLRYVGMVTIILNDYPALKYVLVSIMGLFVLTNKEEA